MAAAPVQELGKSPVIQPDLPVPPEHIDLAGPGVPYMDDELLAAVTDKLVSGLALHA